LPQIRAQVKAKTPGPEAKRRDENKCGTLACAARGPDLTLLEGVGCLPAASRAGGGLLRALPGVEGLAAPRI
jgi:hypothetical protein